MRKNQGISACRSLAEKAFKKSHAGVHTQPSAPCFTPATTTALCTTSLSMASASPAAPELPVNAAHAEALTNSGSDLAPESAISPRIQGVHDHDFVGSGSVGTLPDASDKEDALAAGESITTVITIILWSELACVAQVTPC